MSSFKKQAATVLLAAGLATTGCADDQARAVSSGPGVVGVAVPRLQREGPLPRRGQEGVDGQEAAHGV
jgi:hypothetical protein